MDLMRPLMVGPLAVLRSPDPPGLFLLLCLGSLAIHQAIRMLKPARKPNKPVRKPGSLLGSQESQEACRKPRKPRKPRELRKPRKPRKPPLPRPWMGGPAGIGQYFG